jgi:hypothetical protein
MRRRDRPFSLRACRGPIALAPGISLGCSRIPLRAITAQPRARLPNAVRLPPLAISLHLEMTDIVTPNEIAKRLGVSGLRFRNWLRAQKVASHPLLASHEYRTRYLFTTREADQLAAEFVQQVLEGTIGEAVSTPRVATGATRRQTARRSHSHTKRTVKAAAQFEHQRSVDPGHRVTETWMGEDTETLEDLLRPGLRAVAVGMNPSPKSVAAGHYYQGKYGQTFFRPCAWLASSPTAMASRMTAR